MEQIAIGTKSPDEDGALCQTIDSLGLVTLSTDPERDPETRSGLTEFCSTIGINRVHFLGTSKSEAGSNSLSQEISGDIAKGERSRLDQLAEALGKSNLVPNVWIMFAHTWKTGDEVSYFSGNAESLHDYISLNGGPYRVLYVPHRGQYNVDLDTPLIWRLTNK